MSLLIYVGFVCVCVCLCVHVCAHLAVCVGHIILPVVNPYNIGPCQSRGLQVMKIFTLQKQI